MRQNRNILLWIVGYLFTAGYGMAQLEVRVELENNVVLLYETVIAQVKIMNNSSEKILLADYGAARLSFIVEDSARDKLVARTKTRILSSPVVLQPWLEETVKVNLLSAYQLRQASAYKVLARIHWENKDFTSNRAFLDVVNGMNLVEKRATLQGSSEMGTYTLLALHRDGKQQLFLRLTNDPRELCYGVYALGPYIRMQMPEMSFDGQGRMHVLHQSAPARFTHSIMNQRMVSSEYYSGASGQVNLVRQSGTVMVEGGRDYVGDASVAPRKTKRLTPVQ